MTGDGIDPKDLVGAKLIGKGRYGSVYVTTYRGTKQKYALKKLPKGVAGHTTDFYIRERQALSHIPKHDRIIKMFGYYETPDDAYFILEFFDGYSLQRIMSESRPSCPEKFINRAKIKFYLLQVIEGLKHLHKNHVYHCDLKPENILMDDNEVKIVDFGCSIISEGGVVTGREISFLGTPGFMPPEASDYTYTGKIFLKDLDIWAFGATTYYAYTRTVPFVHGYSCYDVFRNVRKLDVDFSILTNDVETFLRRIFVHNPSLRYNTLEEMEKAFINIEE